MPANLEDSAVATGLEKVSFHPHKIPKDDADEVLHSFVSKFGKFSSGHRTGEGQFSFQSQRKVTTKNSQTTTQLHFTH